MKRKNKKTPVAVLRAKLKKAFGTKAKLSSVRMRLCADVPKFLKKLDDVERQSEKSTLHFRHD